MRQLTTKQHNARQDKTNTSQEQEHEQNNNKTRNKIQDKNIPR